VILGAAGACTFPSYLIEKERELPIGGSSGSAGSGKEGGAPVATNGGESGMSGAPAVDAGAGAGGRGEDGLTFEPQPWSTTSIDQLGFSLLGSATLDASGVALTQLDMKGQSGALLLRDRLQLEADTKLHVAVRFRILSGSPSGDGFALVFHNSPQGSAVLGNAGGGLGYAGLNPCAAIEVDTAGTADADNPAPHLALVPECLPQEHKSRITDLGGDVRDGTPWRLVLEWDAASDSLEVTLFSESTQQERLLSDHFDLATAVGTSPFFAVMAASGEFTATHLITDIELAGAGIGPRALSASPPAAF
jgi:hypothetical protein